MFVKQTTFIYNNSEIIIIVKLLQLVKLLYIQYSLFGDIVEGFILGTSRVSIVYKAVLQHLFIHDYTKKS
jgi:hypothetical protein